MEAGCCSGCRGVGIGPGMVGVGYFLYTIYLISASPVVRKLALFDMLILESVWLMLRVAVSFSTQLWVQLTALCSRSATLRPRWLPAAEELSPVLNISI